MRMRNLEAESRHEARREIQSPRPARNEILIKPSFEQYAKGSRMLLASVRVRLPVRIDIDLWVNIQIRIAHGCGLNEKLTSKTLKEGDHTKYIREHSTYDRVHFRRELMNYSYVCTYIGRA